MPVSMDEERIRRREKAKKRRIRNTIAFSILTVLLLLSISSTVYMVYLYKDMDRQAREAKEKVEELETQYIDGSYITKEEAAALAAEAENNKAAEYLSFIRGTFEDGGGTLTVLEELYPDLVVVPYSEGYAFEEIDNSLKMKTWNPDAFIYPVKNEETNKHEGRASYDDGQVTAHFGIDVSTFQGKINWNKVKNDGVEYAYMRLGYRGYDEGQLYLDKRYEDNIKGCNEVGLDCGVYFFTEAKTPSEGIEEAEYVLENIADYSVELPIVIDVETSANPSKSRTRNLTSEERTEIVIAFCERIKEAGHDVMIYGNLNSLMLMLDFDKLEDYDKWFAYYRYPIRFPYNIKMWQYSATGDVAGVSGDCDMNLMFY